MALKTFCDRCQEEIPRTKLHLVKHELVLTRNDEDQLGNIVATETLRKEFCKRCAQVVRNAILFVAKNE